MGWVGTKAFVAAVWTAAAAACIYTRGIPLGDAAVVWTSGFLTGIALTFWAHRRSARHIRIPPWAR